MPITPGSTGKHNDNCFLITSDNPTSMFMFQEHLRPILAQFMMQIFTLRNRWYDKFVAYNFHAFIVSEYNIHQIPFMPNWTYVHVVLCCDGYNKYLHLVGVAKQFGSVLAINTWIKWARYGSYFDYIPAIHRCTGMYVCLIFFRNTKLHYSSYSYSGQLFHM